MSNPNDLKRCPRCGWSMPLSAFAGDVSKASGRKSWCKHCDREKSRTYYREHAAEVVARQLAARRAKAAESPQSRAGNVELPES